MNTRIFLLGGLLAAPVFSCLVSFPARAQQKAAVSATAGDETLTLKAQKATGQWGDKQGLKLEGTAAQPAHVIHPQLDVAAPKIDASFDDNRQLKNITATGGVQFKVSMTQKNGPLVRIEARCDNAALERTTAARVVTLNGGVDGWFQSGDGPRNQLRGQSVTITSQPDAATSLVANIKGDAQGIRLDMPPPGKAAPDAKPITITAQNAQLRQSKTGLDADVDGGAQGVRLEIPALPKSEKADALSMGAVVVTAQRASVRQAEGTAQFTGNARMLSNNEGQAKFDVSADELTLNRKPTGEIDVLKSKGRTRVKVDLPPDTKAQSLTAKNKMAFSKPNYLEIEANSATAELSKKSLTFEGDVKGFYRVPAVGAATGAAEATQPKDYPFSGEQAYVSYSPAAGGIAQGLNVVLSGDLKGQAVIVLPGFSLDNF